VAPRGCAKAVAKLRVAQERAAALHFLAAGRVVPGLLALPAMSVSPSGPAPKAPTGEVVRKPSAALLMIGNTPVQTFARYLPSFTSSSPKAKLCVDATPACVACSNSISVGRRLPAAAQ